MRAKQSKLGVALLATTAFVAVAQAQTPTSMGPCVNDLPTPYHQVTDWVHMSRPWAPTNNVYVDNKDNLWVFDRCEDKGCAGSTVAPIWEISPDGKEMKNFGAGMFVYPHALIPNPDGTLWAVDGQPKDGKGDVVMKINTDGKILMTLGTPGQGGKGLDVFDQPTSVAIAPNGDIFVGEGHAPTFGNSRIMKFDKNGKFLMTFGHVGPGDGEMKSPHVLAFNAEGWLFVADRSNSRVDIFNQDGKFLASWKQFGRPSGIWIDKKSDTLYVSDSESEDAPGKDTNNPNCKRGVRVGSAKTGKVEAYIPPPPVPDPKLPPPEGIAADSHGNIYTAAVQAKAVYKYVKN